MAGKGNGGVLVQPSSLGRWVGYGTKSLPPQNHNQGSLGNVWNAPVCLPVWACCAYASLALHRPSTTTTPACPKSEVPSLGGKGRVRWGCPRQVLLVCRRIFVQSSNVKSGLVEPRKKNNGEGLSQTEGSSFVFPPHNRTIVIPGKVRTNNCRFNLNNGVGWSGGRWVMVGRSMPVLSSCNKNTIEPWERYSSRIRL